jgi:hypothetical protein
MNPEYSLCDRLGFIVLTHYCPCFMGKGVLGFIENILN